MRALVAVPLGIGVAVAGCAAIVREGRPPLPALLGTLTLVEDHPSITPARFDHARHADPAAMGKDVACADCHHPLREDPGAIPRACASCHLPLYLQPKADPGAPHEHRGPPDL